MAQWIHMSQMIQCLPHETVNNLYPPSAFPIEVRHFLAEWIENQRWYDTNTYTHILHLHTCTHKQLHIYARIYTVCACVSLMHSVFLFIPNLVCGSICMFTCTSYLCMYLRAHRDDFALEKVEQESQPAQMPDPPQFPSMQDVDHLVLNVLDKRFQLLKKCVDCLDQCQTRLISRLKAWRWEQHKATIGHPFDDNLNPLQTWCEQLLGVNGKLRQELMLIGEPIPELQDRLRQLLQVLIQSSLVVEKQPPQVIKTQSKFSTTVRYLLGEKVAPGKPVVLKAQIINELQARNLGSVPGDNVGELINNTAILEHNTSSKSTCATFRNMSIKKIKRADRKGSESVTEEKFALLFSTEITITGCDTPYRIQMISLPVVVIVHGSQDNNALATIIWDCAFSEPDRVPFVVPERVPWRMMYSTLNSKFTAEVQTNHNLDQYNQHFLAQKIFDKPDFADDFSNIMVSWAQFNKEVLPGRPFTFWQWFEGVMDLTKKHLKTYWSQGLIFGFIGKQHLHLILKDRPNGTFLLRFSDSEIGGITIAYVSASENGGQKIQNIQPFTKRDLEIRSLGDRIRDISHITHLYPEYPKHEVFKGFYSASPIGGYIPVSLQTKVGT
uniref:Signal transducer and activator of transcription n=1 Tax=Dicentrarchus labrax TaxID=13489 RepID=A0A8C4NXD7_DICLA